MAARRFGAVDLAANTYTVLMTGSSGKDSTVNIRFVNRNAPTTPSSSGAYHVLVRLALVPFDSSNAIANLDDSDFLEYDALIPPQDVLENSGISVEPGHSLVVWSDSNFVNAIAYGFEEER